MPPVTIHRLYRCGYPVLVLESGYPRQFRRCVAFSEAVYDGTSEVEGNYLYQGFRL